MASEQRARWDAVQPDGALHGDAAPKGEKRACLFNMETGVVL